MRKKRKKEEVFKRRRIAVISSLLFIVCCSGVVVFKLNSDKDKSIDTSKNIDEKPSEKPAEEVKKVEKKEVLITSVGDCTLGTDTNFGYSTSFNAEVANAGNDYSTIMKNVKDIFENDDYTLANLETTFTDAKEKKDKGAGTTFHFKGPKSFVNILTKGSIEGVTVANNHIYDYGKKGFEDTIQTLDEADVDYCGEGHKIIKEIKGIKFAFLGYQAWADTKEIREEIKSDIEDCRDEGATVVIPYFHWGIERAAKPYDVQTNLARFAIDSGADMVLGAHPHVIQSMENYKGKLIAYSLGNFSFGGNSNPSDKRALMLQSKFKFENDELKGIEYKVIPTSISSTSSRNDYRPTPYKSSTKEEVLKYVNSLSNLNGKIDDEFFALDK